MAGPEMTFQTASGLLLAAGGHWSDFSTLSLDDMQAMPDDWTSWARGPFSPVSHDVRLHAHHTPRNRPLMRDQLMQVSLDQTQASPQDFSSVTAGSGQDDTSPMSAWSTAYDYDTMSGPQDGTSPHSYASSATANLPPTTSRRTAKRVLGRTSLSGDDDDSDNDKNQRRKKRPTAPAPSDDDDFDDTAMSCPFRHAHPEIYNNDNNYSNCHTLQATISSAVRHLERKHQVFRNKNRVGHPISTFHLAAGSSRHPAAGLCRTCWSSFTDADVFAAHVNGTCRKVSRGKQQKHQILVATFCRLVDEVAQEEDNPGAAGERNDEEVESDSDNKENEGQVGHDGRQSGPVSSQRRRPSQRNFVTRQEHEAVLRDNAALSERLARLEQALGNLNPTPGQRPISSRGGLSVRGSTQRTMAGPSSSPRSPLARYAETPTTTTQMPDENQENPAMSRMPSSSGSVRQAPQRDVAITPRAPLRRSPPGQSNRGQGSSSSATGAGAGVKHHLRVTTVSTATPDIPAPVAFPSTRLRNHPPAGSPFPSQQGFSSSNTSSQAAPSPISQQHTNPQQFAQQQPHAQQQQQQPVFHPGAQQLNQAQFWANAQLDPSLFGTFDLDTQGSYLPGSSHPPGEGGKGGQS